MRKNMSQCTSASTISKTHKLFLNHEWVEYRCQQWRWWTECPTECSLKCFKSKKSIFQWPSQVHRSVQSCSRSLPPEHPANEASPLIRRKKKNWLSLNARPSRKLIIGTVTTPDEVCKGNWITHTSGRKRCKLADRAQQWPWQLLSHTSVISARSMWNASRPSLPTTN